MQSLTVVAALALGLVLLPAAPPLSAGPEKVAFPSGDQRTRACLGCHKPKAAQDYVFSSEKLIGAR